MKKIFLVLFALLFANLILAAGTPSLQITSQTTAPEKLYPDTSAQLKLTLYNGGTDTATDVIAYYDYANSGLSNPSISAGDIGPGGSTPISMPLNIPKSVESGTFIVYLRIYYSDSTGTSTKTMHSSMPITVSQAQIFKVTTLAINPKSIQPGDDFEAVLQIANTGGVMKNMQLTMPNAQGFSLAGNSQYEAGTITFNSSKIISLKISSASTTVTGKYSIPVIATYTDNSGNTINQTAYVGPLEVMETSAQYKVNLVPTTPVEIGGKAEFKLTLENRGSNSASAIVEINGTSAFTIIGSSIFAFDNILPSNSQTATLNLGIESSATSAYYELPIVITSNGRKYTQRVGIEVSATPDILVTYDQPAASAAADSRINIQIANIGNTAIRSLYITAKSTPQVRITSSPEKFIGTLNIDDSATFQPTFSLRPGAQAGNASLEIEINFKDSRNTEHQMTKIIPLGGTAQTSTGGQFQQSQIPAGANGNIPANANFRTRGNVNPIWAFVTAYWWAILIAIAALGAGGFFAYKKWFSKPKKQKE